MSTTGERLSKYMSGREFSIEGLTALAIRRWQIIAIVALIVLAASLRLWGLGDRAVHHDESIHMKFAWDIAQGGAYTHDPVYHGPLQYFGTAATFKVFGDSDYTARLLPALFGIALVGLPFLLRRQLGTLGAFTAAGLLAISPALLYFSRFARNDIYVAFFTLAMVVCIWRYMEDRRNGWLIAIAPLLALSFAAKEVTYIIVAVLLVFLNIHLARMLVMDLRASRSMTLLQAAAAYAILVPTAWLIVAVWPVTEGIRKRLSFSEMPATGHLLIVFGTIVAAQYAAAIQRVPFVDDQGYMGEGDLMRWSVLLLILGGAYVGLLWNWRVWLIAGGLFYGVYVLLFTGFFSNMGGFWTGIWGSMDYWLQQQGVRRGDQPDYYYFILLPVYEFLPLVFALGGALFYSLRGKLEQRLLAAAALLLVLVLSVGSDDMFFVGEFRIQLAFVIAIGAVVLLSMDWFTKFLLFWTLSILFGLTVAGEKMPWLTVHLALPIVLLAARVLNDILSTVSLRAKPAAEERETKLGAESTARAALASLLLEPIALFAGGATLAVIATILFQAFGPASGISVLAWLLSAGALGVVLWVGRTVSWRTAGQIAAVSLFGALLVFTVRAGGTAAFDQGDPNGVPPELLIYAQGSPGLGVVNDNIERIAKESGRGHDLKIVIDNSTNIWPWPWYMRDYTSVEYNSFADDFTPQPGSVVLVSTGNQAKMQPFLDQYNTAFPYTHMWWFPEFYKNLDTESFLKDAFSGDLLDTWRGYFIDRTVPNATSTPNMLAFFPKEFGAIDVPPPSPSVAPPAPLLPAESVTVLGGPGAEAGQFSQPADLAVDTEGNVYVVDTLNHRVQRLDPDGTATTFGKSGMGSGQFADPRDVFDDYDVADGPWGIGIGPDGNIYVADTWNSRILQLDPDLTLIPGWEIGGLFGPRDVAVGIDGNLLVVDTGNKRIMQYAPDGTLVRAFGAEGDGRGEFNEPTSVSVTPNGDTYIADFWNQRIQHFDRELRAVREIEVPSWGSPGITDRAYIVALADGTVLATDPANGRIIVFDPSGEEQAAWSLPTAAGASRPVGIAVDAAEQQVYISDGLTSQVVQVPLAALLALQAP